MSAAPIPFTSPGGATLTPMHPALDIVRGSGPLDGTLYVTVLAHVEGRGLTHAVLTSDCNVFLPEGWKHEYEVRGLLPRAEVNLKRCGPRWSEKALRQFQAHKLRYPDWAQTFTQIRDALDDRLVVSEPVHLDVLALYAMMTYFHCMFDYLPILHLRGPAASGKSRAGSALAHVAFNGVMEGSATRAGIFRQAHQGRFTQILAEGDHLASLGSGDTFVRDLQSSCSKGEATVEVAEGKGVGGKGGYEPVTYYTFSPRVILSTRAFQSQPLRSRCIELDLVKSAHPDMDKLTLSVEDDDVWAPLRHRLYKHQLLLWVDVQIALYQLNEGWRGPGEPSGRTRDNWLPLMVMASLVSDEVCECIKALAREDTVRQQHDTANTFESAIMKFAAWLVRDGHDRDMGRKALYDAFIGDGAMPHDFQAELRSPQWARETETTVTREQLRQWVKGQGALLTELQRLTLVPKLAEHTERGNVYHLDAQHIRGIAEAYVGKLTALDAEEDDE